MDGAASGHNRRAVAESRHNWRQGAAAEAGTIGEQQLIGREQGAVASLGRCNWGAAVEVDAIGEQQLK